MLVLVGITPIKADSAPRHVRTTFREHRLVANGAHPASRGAAGATVTTTTTPAGLDSFQVGYDYTQNSHLPSFAGGDPTAVASAKSLLTSMATFQNAFLMGWGTDDPEPYPGTFAWSSLDSSVEVMGSTVLASRRMITLASAPGWMKVGGASQEWNMNAAVDPSHFQDFANLAADVAQRYDGTHIGANGQLLPRVDYFDVWNELKGFWTSSGDTWNYQSYTEMYNDVYKAIKAVRPDALVGGPYAPVGAATAADIADPSSIRGRLRRRRPTLPRCHHLLAPAQGWCPVHEHGGWTGIHRGKPLCLRSVLCCRRSLAPGTQQPDVSRSKYVADHLGGVLSGPVLGYRGGHRTRSGRRRREHSNRGRCRRRELHARLGDGGGRQPDPGRRRLDGCGQAPRRKANGPLRSPCRPQRLFSPVPPCTARSRPVQ